MPRHFLLLLAIVALGARPASGLDDSAIVDAIGRMQSWLLARQDPGTGSFSTLYDSDRHRGGASALVTHALLASGISAQHPQVAAAVRHLRGVDMNGTYAVAVRMHVWAGLPAELYGRALESDADFLILAQRQGLFDYGPRQGIRYDHSVTQYGVLGLWEYAKRSGAPHPMFWDSVMRHFLDAQNDDGGWGYVAGSRSTDAMTAAGLTTLYIAQQQLHRSQPTPLPECTEAIAGALRWLEHRAFAEGLAGKDKMYDLYAVERVGLAGGVKTLGGRDWYVAGAEYVLDRMRQDGSIDGDEVDTAFALLFLARGRVPVWANKVKVGEHDWNNRPNDIYFATRWLSDVREQELNWQVVGLQTPAEQWLNAPIAWLSGSQTIDLPEAEAATLKRYLDLGGTLVVSADGRALALRRSVEAMVQQWYPQHEARDLPADHPLFRSLYPVSFSTDRPVRAISNGVRDVAIILPDDAGRQLQIGERPEALDPHHLLANLHAMVTAGSRKKSRMSTPWVDRQARWATGRLTVARVRHEGQWDVEPLAWLPLENLVFNRTGVVVDVLPLPAAHLDPQRVPLAHLAGVQRTTLSETDLRELWTYAERGGIVLVETVGGRGDFSLGVEDQFAALLGHAARPLKRSSPIFTGESLDGGRDCRRVYYRRRSLLDGAVTHAPRLTAIKPDGDRGGLILFSHEDLSLGALGAEHVAINGYDPQSARDLLTNLMLLAGPTLAPDSSGGSGIVQVGR